MNINMMNVYKYVQNELNLADYNLQKSLSELENTNTLEQ